MTQQSNLWFAAVPPANVPTPNPGYFALFISDGTSGTAAGFVHKKDSDGLVTTAVQAPNNYTDEMAQDAIGATLISSASVTLTYDDAGNTITALVPDSAVTTAKLSDGAVTTVKLADYTVTTIKLATGAVTAGKLAANAVTTTALTDASVTLAKLADMPAATFTMRAVGAGTGVPINGTPAQAKSALGIAVADVAGLGTAATANSTAFDPAGAAAAAQAASQPLDSDLTAVAALTTTSYGRSLLTLADAAADTAQLVTATQALKGLLSAADKTRLDNFGTAATQNSTAFDPAGAAASAQAAAIAASQPLDADLTAIAALATAGYGRSLLTLLDAAANTAQLNAATTALKGLMSAADKARSDNAATGVYNVLNYGIAPGNTAAANLAAWNTLMTTVVDNASVFFPPGPAAYQFSGTCAIPAGKHLRVCGTSNQKSVIATTSATADMFTVGDWYNEFAGLKFTSTVTRTAGAGINSGNNVAVSVYDCDFAGMWDALLYTGGANAGNLAIVSNLGITGTLNRGIVLDGQNANTIIEKVIMDGTSGVCQAGLALLQCGSVLVSNCDFIRSVNNLLLAPVSPNGVFSAYFINVFFDTSSASSVKFAGTGNIQRVKFTNCWFSGSVTGCEFVSTAATLPTAVDFIGCDIFGNSSRGIWAHGVQDFSVTNSRIAGNTTAGVELSPSAAAVTKFNLQNNMIGPTAGFGANGTGVLINPGVYGGYCITGNDVRANTTGNITDGGSVTTTDLRVLDDNIGHLVLGAVASLAAPSVTSGAVATALLTARLPANAVNVGQVLRAKLLGVSAGIGTLIFKVHVGPAGTTGDPVAWTSITSAAQNTSQRAGFDAVITVRSIGAAGTVQCEGLGFAQAALLPTVVAAAAVTTCNTTVPIFITLSATCSFSTFTAQQAVVEAL